MATRAMAGFLKHAALNRIVSVHRPVAPNGQIADHDRYRRNNSASSIRQGTGSLRIIADSNTDSAITERRCSTTTGNFVGRWRQSADGHGRSHRFHAQTPTWTVGTADGGCSTAAERDDYCPTVRF